jgi:hypothetical protein
MGKEIENLARHYVWWVSHPINSDKQTGSKSSSTIPGKQQETLQVFAMQMSGVNSVPQQTQWCSGQHPVMRTQPMREWALVGPNKTRIHGYTLERNARMFHLPLLSSPVNTTRSKARKSLISICNGRESYPAKVYVTDTGIFRSCEMFWHHLKCTEIFRFVDADKMLANFFL